MHCETVKDVGSFEKRRNVVGSICKKCKNAKQNARYHADEAFKLSMNESAKIYTNNRYAIDANYRLSERIRKQHRRAAGTLTPAEWLGIVALFNCECAYCGSHSRLTMDHVVPVSRGGKTTLDNIIPACSSCNSSKQARDIIEWYTSQPFYSKNRLDNIIKFVTTRR